MAHKSDENLQVSFSLKSGEVNSPGSQGMSSTKSFGFSSFQNYSLVRRPTVAQIAKDKIFAMVRQYMSENNVTLSQLLKEEIQADGTRVNLDDLIERLNEIGLDGDNAAKDLKNHFDNRPVIMLSELEQALD